MNTINDFAAGHPLLALAVLAAVIAAVCLSLTALYERIDNRLETRRGINDLEHFANHPANRTRKEDRP